MTYKFYDTCSLIHKADHLWEDEEQMVISSITLEELEHIKTSANKDPDVKHAARKVTHELDLRYGEYSIVTWNSSLQKRLEAEGMDATPDNKIIVSAMSFRDDHLDDEFVFVSNDLCCKHLARLHFDRVESYEEEPYEYDGYQEVSLSPNEMSYFYSHYNENIYNLHINEYLIIRDAEENNKVVDQLCWTAEGYRHMDYGSFKSQHFGDIKPMKGDPYQACVADSLNRNRITMIKGPAGTGKTYLSLGFLMHKLEKNKIDKIIVFCNTVATKNSAKLGYYPGTKDEKLLDSQIGNLLVSKLGDKFIVEQMISDGKLVLLPMSDIRGYDTSGMKAGIYISEAQNLDIELMKLTLQRIGEDSICIIDGDCKAQVDDVHFAGSSNGMKRASWAYRGEDVYGEITLKNIYRSRIAQIAEKM